MGSGSKGAVSYYAKLSDGDIRALYAFVMTRLPVEEEQVPDCHDPAHAQRKWQRIGGRPAVERDVRAMATYIASLQRPISSERRHRIDEILARASHHEIVPANEHSANIWATLFAGACANCHAGGPSLIPPRGIDLALGSAVSAPDPRNAILTILHGIQPGEGQRGPLMPPFGNAFTDGQIAALLGYVRENYSDQPAWKKLEARIREIRQGKERS